MTAHREALCAKARAEPSNVLAQIEAAGACDNDDLEEAAVVFYDAAWKLGVPADLLPGFLIGYGSTLKNVGRLEESEARLREAMQHGSVNPAARAFLALTLLRAAKPEAAVAELVELLLAACGSERSIARYRKALGFYADALKEQARSNPREP